MFYCITIITILYNNLAVFVIVRDPTGLSPITVKISQFGGPARFMCYSEGPVTWFYRQMEGLIMTDLPPNVRTQYWDGNFYILQIDSVRQYHLGNYICFFSKYASNDTRKGSDKYYFYDESTLAKSKGRPKKL